MNEWKGQMDKHAQTDGHTCTSMYRLAYCQTRAWIDGWTERQKYGQADVWIE